MKFATILFNLALIGTVSATPIAASEDPPEEFNGPQGWQFALQSWDGNACPDYQSKNTTPGYMKTRQSSGPFWNSSLSTYWSYFAFPWMQTTLDLNDPSRMAISTCTLQIGYEEVTEYGHGIPVDKRTHRLRLHKNGTLVQANYKLDKNVAAEWQVRYIVDKEFTIAAQDFGSVEGPYEAGNETTMPITWLEPLYTSEPVVLPECGSGTFSIRFEMMLAGRAKGVGGRVESKKINWNNGEGPLWSGVNLGYSFDWERC